MSPSAAAIPCYAAFAAAPLPVRTVARRPRAGCVAMQSSAARAPPSRRLRLLALAGSAAVLAVALASRQPVQAAAAAAAVAGQTPPSALPRPVISAGDQRAVVLRMLGAVVGGGLIGVERHAAGALAGLRTTALVSLGSAVFTLTAILGFGAGSPEAARIAAQIVTGVGFIGAGCMTSVAPAKGELQSGRSRRGLSTATGIWISAAVGVASATGLFSLALSASLMTIAILRYNAIQRYLARRFKSKRRRQIEVAAATAAEQLAMDPKLDAMDPMQRRRALEGLLRESRSDDISK